MSNRPLTLCLAVLCGVVSARAAFACSDASELERKFELKASNGGELAVDGVFEYAGCDEYPRNDYQPPYAERTYRSADNFVLTIVTDQGKPVSDVVLSQRKRWASRFGSWDQANLLPGKLLDGEY